MKKSILYCLTILTLGCNLKEKSEIMHLPEKSDIIVYQYKCDELTQLLSDSSKVSIDTVLYTKALTLVLYIDSLKTELLNVTNQIDPKKFELNAKGAWKKPLTNIDSLYSYKTISAILINEPDAPRQGKWSVNELTERINEYKIQLNQHPDFTPVFNHLQTDKMYILSDMRIGYDITLFFHMPLIKCLISLTDIEIETMRITNGALKHRQQNEKFVH
jgi:hypothetical protein